MHDLVCEPVEGQVSGAQAAQSVDSIQLTCWVVDVDLTLKVRFWEAKNVEPDFVAAWQFHLYVPSVMPCFLNCWVDGEEVAVLVSSFFHAPELSV